VVSATDPYGRILGFLDLSRYFVLSSSSSIVLTTMTMSQRYINITITILNIIHRPVFYLKNNVSETGFCLCL
jgi:hypothetical protein